MWGSEDNNLVGSRIELRPSDQHTSASASCVVLVLLPPMIDFILKKSNFLNLTSLST